jgi:IclR family transcriptional regulator, acetate operon repressor
VQSVDRAFALFAAIGRSDSGARLSELAAQVGLHRSTAHNLLATLESLGYVAQPSAGGPYIVTDLVADLYRSATGGDVLLRGRMRPMLEEVVALTGETCCLAVSAGQDYLCVDVVETRQPLRLSIDVGKRDRMLGTAIGHLLLAHRPESASYVERKFPNEWAQWLPSIELARTSGIALEFEGYRPDRACVAVPIRQNGAVYAALCILGPSSRLPLDRLRELGDVATKVAQTAEY